MIYYANGSKLYASDVEIADESFAQITEDEYNTRLSNAIKNREQGNPTDELNGNIATENDYINALESLGVDFNG